MERGMDFYGQAAGGEYAPLVRVDAADGERVGAGGQVGVNDRLPGGSSNPFRIETR